MKKLTISLLVVLLVGLMVYAQKNDLEKKDLALGTWKLNVAKSKYNPGPAPKEVAVKVDSEGDTMKVNVQGTDSKGEPISVRYSFKPDGKDYPVMGSKTADSVTYKRIDDLTRESTTKKEGKVVSKSKHVFSQDGKVLTINSTGTDPEGKKFNNVAVYEKE